MRYLILSDMHSNFEALEACVAAVEGRYERIVCCGDIVGYGADPNRTIEWVREHVREVVRGNHDKAGCGLGDARDFNAAARAAAHWTQNALTPENLAYLRELPSGPIEVSSPGRSFHLVHGSIGDEDEYVVAVQEAAREMERLPLPVTFFGHTHVQGGFLSQGQAAKILRPHHNAGVSMLTLEMEDRRKYLLNPGSVGQPRDGDNRAAFAIYDIGERMVEYWRVPYDVAAAQQRILAAGLPDVLAYRLTYGR